MQSIAKRLAALRREIKTEFLTTIRPLLPGWRLVQTEWIVEDEMVFSATLEGATDRHLTVWLHPTNRVTVTYENGDSEQREKSFREKDWRTIPEWVG